MKIWYPFTILIQYSISIIHFVSTVRLLLTAHSHTRQFISAIIWYAPPNKLHYWLRYSRCLNDHSLPLCVSEVYMKNEPRYLSSLWENLRCTRKTRRWDISRILKTIYFSVFRPFSVTPTISSIRHSKCLIALNGLWHEESKTAFCINRRFHFTGAESRIYRFFVAIWHRPSLELRPALFRSIHDWQTWP